MIRVRLDGPDLRNRWPGPNGEPRLPAASQGAPTELEVLQAMSRAFGSSRDFEEAGASAARWIRAAVASEEAGVRIYLVSVDGRLELAVPRLEAADEPGRLAERRRIFESRRPSVSQLADGRTMAIIPLVCRGEGVGVVEVSAAAGVLESRWTTLEAVTSQVAIVFRNLAHARHAADTPWLREMAGMAGEIVRSGSPERAVRAAVSFFRERFDRPAAGWLSRGDPSRFELVSARGLGSLLGAEVRSHMRILRRSDLVGVGSERVAARFAELAGIPSAEAAVAGDAVLVMGGPVPGGLMPFRLVQGLLEDVLEHLAVVAKAERRNERLDLGIALTAHEVRAPLVGAMAIIERLIMEGGRDEEGRSLLRRSQEQLEQLSGLVDGLLRWAVAGEPLDLEATDLGRLVHEAVESCAHEGGAGRVAVSASAGVEVLADRDHLRGAVANVVRNALVYSPSETEVRVAVRTGDGKARVTVRDRGPGVPQAERDSIFDPFMRGAAAHLSRTGNGLGLFIARRVLEAHSGSIWVSEKGRGAKFTMQLPLSGRTR